MSAFPKTLLVVEDGAGTDDAFFMIVEKEELAENGQAIATYEKVSSGRVKITKEIV